jgi:hypothetical protein
VAPACFDFDTSQANCVAGLGSIRTANESCDLSISCPFSLHPAAIYKDSDKRQLAAIQA